MQRAPLERELVDHARGVPIQASRGASNTRRPSAPTLLRELSERDGLPFVRAQSAGQLRRNVTGLHASVLVPDRDRVRVVLVVGLGKERERAPGAKPSACTSSMPVADARDRDDVDPRVVLADDLLGLGVAQPVAGARALEPEAETLGHGTRRPGSVVGVVRRRRGGRGRKRVLEERPDDDVTLTGKSPPQRRLLEVAELPRHPEARDVRRVDSDLDAVRRRSSSNATRVKRRGRLGHQAFAHAVHVDPVADLERVVADALVQTGAADDRRLVAVEDAVDEIGRRGRSRPGTGAAARSSRPAASARRAAQGIHGRRWPRLASIAFLSRGASRGSQHRTTRRSVTIRYGGSFSIRAASGRRSRHGRPTACMHPRSASTDTGRRTP